MQNIHLGTYIVGYMVGNHDLQLHSGVAGKYVNIPPQMQNLSYPLIQKCNFKKWDSVSLGYITRIPRKGCVALQNQSQTWQTH